MSAQLSSREKNLSIAVGVILFLAVTFLVGDYFRKNQTRLTADLAAKTRQLKMMESLTADQALWEQREKWLREKQPKLPDDDSGGVKLLDEIKQLAKAKQVLLEKQVIRPVVSKPEYSSITVELETKSPWPALIAFLGTLQTPERFIVIESANLKIDATDQTQMRGRFKISRWFAPK